MTTTRQQAAEEIFKTKVNNHGSRNSYMQQIGRCWDWTSSKNQKGYGLFYSNGKAYKAHRIAWELENGIIPSEMIICHHCDNPSCVRPSHLFLGTPKDNTQDMMKKGRYRGACGELHGESKLTEAQVIDIRKRKAAGATNASLGRHFGVSVSNISLICLNKSWKQTKQ